MAKGKKKRANAASEKLQVSGDPNLPTKDGPYVSENGGLIFVVCIWGLVLVAVVSQFLSGG